MIDQVTFLNMHLTHLLLLLLLSPWLCRIFKPLRDLFEQTGFVELATRFGDRVAKSADEMEGNECVSMKGNEAP